MRDLYVQSFEGIQMFTVQSQGERRQVTIFFCDVVDSTAMTQRFDPEELRDVMQQVQMLCAQTARSYGGFVARYMGDGILVYFGYPVAREDAASCAIRAGLKIIRRISDIRTPDGNAVRVRTAVATGLGVVGDVVGTGSAAEIGITGSVVNLAARLLTAAAPGTLVVSDASRKLTLLDFAFEDMGLHSFKGFEQKIRVWHVQYEHEDRTRYESSLDSSRFVGREEDLENLKCLWGTASRGTSQIAILRGEAGLGKTALLRQFEAELRGEPFTRILLQCSQQHADSPLYPLIFYLRRVAGIDSSDTTEIKLRKIESLLPTVQTGHGLQLLAGLLSVSGKDDNLSLTLPPARQKTLTLQLISHYVCALAEQRPVLILIEDAHWIDPTSEELIEYLVGNLRSSRVLAIIAARPEYSPVWSSRPMISIIALAPLTKTVIRAIVEHVGEARTLPTDVVDEIILRSEGIPLFAEELTKTTTEWIESEEEHSGSRPVSIPMTLQDSLLARLDRLGSAKELAQVASVLGRKFTVQTLCNACNKAEREIADDLSRLVASGLVAFGVGGDNREYRFKHALVQESAYESLLLSKRRPLHVRTAQMLEDGPPDSIEMEPETLGRHWKLGGRPERAIQYWLKAGQRSVSRAANVEAIRHLREGIAALSHIPDSHEREVLEFNLHLCLGQACYVVDGPAAGSTIAAYARAQALLESVGDGEQRYTVLYGIFSGYHFASRFDLAHGPAMRVLELATNDKDSGHLCQAHRMLGYIAFFQGQTDVARRHFHALVSLYVPGKHGKLAARYGADCRVGALGFLALVECVAGHAEIAIDISAANLAYALELAHPASLGWAYASAGYLCYYLRDPGKAAHIATEGMRYCVDNNVGSWLPHCKAFHLWARSRLHPSSDDVHELRQTIDLAASGNTLGLPLLRTLLAEVLVEVGRSKEALNETQTALADMTTTSQRFFEPNIHLARGHCQKALGLPRADVAKSYGAAAEAARAINAILLESRAMEALQRLG